MSGNEGHKRFHVRGEPLGSGHAVFYPLERLVGRDQLVAGINGTMEIGRLIHLYEQKGEQRAEFEIRARSHLI